MLLREGVRKLIIRVENNHRGLIQVLISLLLIAGIIYSLSLKDQLRYLPDEQDYVILTSNLVSRNVYSLDGVTPTAFRPPGYPLVLVPLGYLSASIVYFRILNYVLLCLSLFITYRLLYEQVSSLTGVIGVLLVMAYPVLFYTAGTLYPQTLGAFLLLLVIYLITHKPVQSINLVLSGLTLGFLVLTVPTNVFLLVVLPLWLFFRYRSIMSAFIPLACAILVIGSWTARNYLVFDGFIFVSTNTGENLLAGNSESATPNGGRTVDLSMYEQQTFSMNEVERDRYYRSKAIGFVFENKIRALKLYVLKVLNYFNFRNDLVTASEGSPMRDVVMIFTYGSLLLLFILRLISLKSFPPSDLEVLFISMYLINALIVAIFFTRIRFRLPYDYLLIVIVAIFLERLIRSVILEQNRSDLSIELGPRMDSPTNPRYRMETPWITA